ncbi:hypothetical protein AB0E04_44680 [Streptomyces sp. NPDC048251]|uniref:hypothetical protein n=1 Tax=Streptomyces sp. NPDC048251 TaxID=3154501 RepID=UPI00344700DE
MDAAGFDQSWAMAFRLLLADPTEGMNLRNDVVHDLVDCPPRHRVALVPQSALMLLCTIDPPAPPNTDEEVVTPS